MADTAVGDADLDIGGGQLARRILVGEQFGAGGMGSQSVDVCGGILIFRSHLNLCPKSQPTCVGRNGGYADAIRVNSRFAIPVPEVLESENVTPLLCGGITVYSPLRNLLASPASRVGVVGIGGLGHLGLQFARAFGCEVTAFSTSADKEAEAKELGAHNFVNSRDSAALKAAAGSLDLILSTVSADQDFQAYVNALRPKGTLCLLGASPSNLSVSPFSLLSGEKAVAGSNIGSPRVIHEMLDVAARHNIKAITESFAMKDANEAIARVKKNQVRYRAVLAN